MKKINLYNDKGIITQDAINEIEKLSSSVSCECPQHLIDILKQVQAFTKYQESCITEKPQDQHTHAWLKTSSINLEHLISGTIINLARLEGMIDHENTFVDSIDNDE